MTYSPFQHPVIQMRVFNFFIFISTYKTILNILYCDIDYFWEFSFSTNHNSLVEMLTISEGIGCDARERERYEVLFHSHVKANNQSEIALYGIIILRYDN